MIGVIGALPTTGSANATAHPRADIQPVSSVVQPVEPCPDGYHRDASEHCVRSRYRQRPHQTPQAAPALPPRVGSPHVPAAPSRPQAAPAAAPVSPPTATPHPASEGAPLVPHAPRILETGYELLPTAEAEKPGYGLYSYAILTSPSERSATFLAQIFTNIRSIQGTAAKAEQVNIFYIPIRADKQTAFSSLSRSSNNSEMVAKVFAPEFYDFKMAQGILDHLCSTPPPFMHDVCAGDLSGGPYILTYPGPVSKYQEVPPPYLFFDLTNLNERAFAELIAAFKARVKGDLDNNTRLISFRLRILSIALTAADWINPVRAAVADIIHSDVSR